MSEIPIEKIRSDQIPRKILYTGDSMPAIGLGTFGSDKYTSEEIANSVFNAALFGYRHFDCAAVYNNEDHIGNTLQRILDTGIKRKDIWVTSKLWNDKHHENNVIEAFEQSRNDLQLDYLDLYLIHWPFPNFHSPGCDVGSRDKNAKPYIHKNYMKTWRQLEYLVEKGFVRNIGTSNMTVPKLRLLLRDAKIKPAVNEMELHPHFQQPELFEFCRNNSIQPVAYSPLGSPSRPERDKTANDTVDMEDPVIKGIAKKRNIHPASVCLKWAVQRGQIPIPFSVKESQYKANLMAITSDPLNDEEMAAIAEIDKNCRLIKGQVFLWDTAKSWKDLWDIDGKIKTK